MTAISAINPLYSLSGLAVGILVGMTGVGGGSLMTPLLVLLFGVHPATAVGTDLLYASITKGVGTVAHGLKETVNWRVAGLLAAGSIPAAALTLLVLAYLGPQNAATGHLISVALGWTLILTSVVLLFRERIVEFASRRRQHSEISPARRYSLAIATGAVLGVLVSISSVGAGALGVTALMVLFPKLPTAKIVGSDIAHAVPLTFVAGMGHWMTGSVNMPLLVSLLIGSIPGILIGSFTSTRVPEAALRRILAATLVLVGCKLAIF